MNELELLREHRDRQPDPSPTVIAEARARLTANAGSGPRRARQRKYAFATAGVVAATSAALIAPAVVGTDAASRAYAVERMRDGSIKVTLREFTDSRRLERKLRSMGVSVVVEYHLEDVGVQPRRIPIAPNCPFRGKPVQRHLTSPLISPGNPPRGREFGDYTFMIHPELIKPGETLVWRMTYDLDAPKKGQAWGLTFSHQLVEGPVKSCR